MLILTRRHSLWVAIVVLQIFYLAWQWYHLQLFESHAASKCPQQKRIALQVMLTDSGKKKKKSHEHIQSLRPGLPISKEMVRVFPYFNYSFPCFPAEDGWNTLPVQKVGTRRGFLYVKARKAGSSTVAGVALRIARSIAQKRHLSTPVCQVRYNHPMASKLKYKDRIKAESFLWSILREPTRRFVSEFFHFGFSRNFIQPTVSNIRKYMLETKPSIHNYYLRWLAVDKPFDYPIDFPNIPRFITSIISEYDFLGISERLDESLVALQMILNLTTSDILYLSSKVNGGWDDGIYRNQCYYIFPSYISDGMKNYFQNSEEWYNFSVGDDLLYRAVNASLEKTIAYLGNDFAKNLRIYRWALKKADMACRQNVSFPCTEGGKRNLENDCMVWDSGCGMECLDRVSKEIKL